MVWGQERFECAVLDFQSQSTDTLAARNMAEALREELFRAGKCDLVARNQMEIILQEQGFQQSGCVGGECQVRTGQVLGVSQIVAGTLARTAEGGWSLRTSRIDVETGKVLGIAGWNSAEGWERFMEGGAAHMSGELWGDTSQSVNRHQGIMTPFALALIYPVQLPFSGVPVRGLAVNALFGKHAEVTGLAVGTAGVVRGRMAGLQVGALYAEAGELWGIQTGLVNNAGTVRGIQVGLVNTCRRLQGVQIGLVNQVTSRSGFGSWLPVINAGF